MQLSVGKFVTLLQRSTLAFVLVLIAFNLTIIKIPFELIFTQYLSFENSKNISRTIHGLIIILFSLWLIQKFSLNQFSGIKLFYCKNPIVFFIPFIYPMALALPNVTIFDLSDLSFTSLALMCVAILSKAMAEEFGFRALLQSYLFKKYQGKLSIYTIVHLAAILFALMHIINLTHRGFIDVLNQVIVAFYFGVFFGAMLLKTRNVIFIGVIHGCINFVFLIGTLHNKNHPTDENIMYSLKEVIKIVVTYVVLMFPLWVIGMLLLRNINKEGLFPIAEPKSK